MGVLMGRGTHLPTKPDEPIIRICDQRFTLRVQEVRWTPGRLEQRGQAYRVSRSLVRGHESLGPLCSLGRNALQRVG